MLAPEASTDPVASPLMIPFETVKLICALIGYVSEVPFIVPLTLPVRLAW